MSGSTKDVTIKKELDAGVPRSYSYDMETSKHYSKQAQAGEAVTIYLLTEAFPGVIVMTLQQTR